MNREKQTFSEMMNELNALLTDMQSEVFDVDEVIAKYEHGQALLAELEAYLKEVKNRIKHRSLDADTDGD